MPVADVTKMVEKVMSSKFFILGGNDGEMVTVAAILNSLGVQFVQPKKEWGDHVYTPLDVGIKLQTSERSGANAYLGRLNFVQPVFVECRPGDGWQGVRDLVEIDHHGARSSQAPAIRQVIDLLGAWTRLSSSTQRWVELVGANDAGFIPAMLALGATQAEVAQIRAADRAAQGITSAHEAEAQRAIVALEMSGRLTTVRMAHSKCATVTDRLHQAAGGAGYDQLLVVSDDGETNFFGDGALCAALKEKFVGSWAGGSGLGQAEGSAYWGGYAPQEEVAEFIRGELAK